jgi:hypothetical protein
MKIKQEMPCGSNQLHNGIKELGSVRRDFLDQHSDVCIPKAKFTLGTRAESDRKATGSYYTPPNLVQYLLDSALDPILYEREYDFAKLGFKSAEEAILSIKVCDAACGSGHFLIAAARRIACRLAVIRTGENEPASTVVRHALREVIGHCIYGVDLNPRAVELCKFRLWLKVLESGKSPSFLDHYIQCGNSLLGLTPALIQKGIPDEIKCLSEQHQFFQWHLAFPEVFQVPPAGQKSENKLCGWNGGFDLSIGNPPWGADWPRVYERLIRYRYVAAQKGVIDTFALFIELSANLTRANGLFALVLPDAFLLKSYSGIRLYLLEHSTIIELAHWGQSFKQVNVDVCTLVARMTKPVASHKIRCLPEVIVEQPSASSVNWIQQKVFRVAKEYRFNLFLSPALQSQIKAASSLGPKMQELFILREGVHSGNVRNKLFLKLPEGDHCEKLIFGGDEISPMILSWKGWYIQLDPKVFDRDAGEYFNLGDLQLHHSRKLLVRRTGDYILAAVDNEGMFCSNNFLLCVAKPGVSYETVLYACVVLNSRFATWLFRAIQPRKGRRFAELGITHLEDISIPFAYDDWAIAVGRSALGWLSGAAKISDALQHFNVELEKRIAKKHSDLAAALRKESSPLIFRHKNCIAF